MFYYAPSVRSSSRSALMLASILMATVRRLHHDYADYLRTLEMGDVKLEFCEGEIYAMAGGTPAHAELGAAVILALGRVLPASCRIATSDLKVRIEASDLSTFPDATVTCGEREVSLRDENAITNPTLLVEVTSKSTEDYDRGEKLSHYKQLPSLKAVLFVAHRTRRITVVERTAEGWTQREARAGELVHVTSPPLSFAVDSVYEGITLDPA